MGLGRPVASSAGGGEGCPMKGESLMPVAPGVEEAGYGCGDQYGKHGPPSGGGVADGCIYIGALSFKPGRCLPGGRQVGDVGGRSASRWTLVPCPGGEVSASRDSGVQVVVQQASAGGVAVRRVVGVSEAAGMFAEQVVQPVAAGCGLDEQVLVIQLIEVPA